jgi:hypothetical protein
MKKQKKITIKLKDSDIELGESEINFYLNETQKKKVEKNRVEKFFNNLVDRFNNVL